jgi:hypothetical protein
MSTERQFMRRAILFVALITACTIPVVGAASAQSKKPQHGAPSIAVKPNPLTFGSRATVSGKATGAVQVTLEAQAYPYDAAFVSRATKTSETNGDYAFTVAPNVSTRYRVVAKSSPTQTSSTVSLSLAWRVGLRVSTSIPSRGAKVRFSGSVAPAHVGGRALLQKLTSAGYRTVASTRLKAGSSTSSVYSLSIRIYRSGSYRVRVPGDGARIAANSRVRSLRVG